MQSIDINEVLFADRFYLGKVSDRRKREYLAIWYRDFVFARYIFPEQANARILYFRSLFRDDYKYFFREVIDSIGEQDAIVMDDYYQPCSSVNIDASRYISTSRHLLPLIEAESPLARACLYIKLCNYLFVLEHIAHLDVEAAIFFSDMQPQELLVARYLKQRGTVTATMQHGLYVDYGNMKTVNVINYRHQPSDYFLAWGQVTADLIQRYHPESKVLICGKPTLFAANDVNSTEPQESQYIYIILDQNIFEDENFEMIAIAREVAQDLGLQLRVKFHPQNDKLKYRTRFMEIEEGGDMVSSDFTIGHTSSLLYESMTLGARVFRFASDIPCVFTPPELEFRTAGQLRAICETSLDFSSISKQYIAYSGDASRHQYRLAYQQMLKIESQSSSEKMEAQA